MLIDTIRTLQVAIVMLAGFTVMIWWPVGVRIGADFSRGSPQMGMNIRLWRILLATIAGVGIAFVGFFPSVMYQMVSYLGARPEQAGVSTLISLSLFYCIILWFASWGRAARQAMRAEHPHPWDSEEWLQWSYLQYVAVIILIGSALMTIVER